MRPVHPFVFAFGLGVASAFAFQPYALWPLMPLALAGLCELAWRSQSLKQSLLVGWGFGLGQFAFGLNWIATAFTFQAKMPPWLGWVAVVLLSIYLAAYPALAAGLGWRFKGKDPAALVLTLAGAWAVTEWLRGTMFTGFPWNPVGVTLVDTGWRGSAALVGTYGLSIFAILLGGMLWLAARRRWWSAGAIFVPLAACWIVFFPFFIPGAYSWKESPDIRVVQPNIGQEDKWSPGFENVAAQRLGSLSLAHRKPPDVQSSDGPRIVFWPEAAVTEPLYDERPAAFPFVTYERLRAASVLRPGDILFTGGLGLRSADERRVSSAVNSVFVLDHSGRVLGRYDKAHLVPYGEYLPMRPLLSAIGLSRLAPGDIDFDSGPGPRTFALPNGFKVGFQVCYEIIFSGNVVDRRNRPDVIFNPSNDAWFGRWGPPQHLAQARLRAAEEGLWVIRSTPTGISAIINPVGGIVDTVPWRQAGVLDSYVTKASSFDPPFARFGNIIPVLLGFLLIASGIVLGRTRR